MAAAVVIPWAYAMVDRSPAVMVDLAEQVEQAAEDRMEPTVCLRVL
jgi:hypothetical protein